MDAQNKKFLILVALIAIWGLIFAFGSPWATSPRRQVPARASVTPRTPAAQGGGLPRLKTELLHAALPAYPPEVHNIFGSPPPPRPAEAPAGAATTTAPPPPDPFQEEAKRLRYIGFLQGGGKAMAFIVQGAEVHTVETGATLFGRFQVQAITEEAVVLSSPSGDKQVRLPLVSEAGPTPKR